MDYKRDRTIREVDYKREYTVVMTASLNLDPLHATVQLGEGWFNLVKFKIVRFYCNGRGLVKLVKSRV